MDWNDVVSLEAGPVAEFAEDGQVYCEAAFNGSTSYSSEDRDGLEEHQFFHGWIYSVYARKSSGEVFAVTDFHPTYRDEAKLFTASLAKALRIPFTMVD